MHIQFLTKEPACRKTCRRVLCIKFYSKILSILLLSDVGERRVEIGDYVIRILRSDGEPDEIFVHSAVVKLLRGELAVSSARRVQAAGAAVRNVGDYRSQLEGVHKPDCVLSAALYPQRNNSASAVRHIFLSEVIILVSLESGVCLLYTSDAADEL